MAGKAMWQHHADPRECLHGIELTSYIYIFYYIGYSKYKPFHRGTSLTYYFTSPYILEILLVFLRVGQNFLFYFDFRTSGITWIVEWRMR